MKDTASEHEHEHHLESQVEHQYESAAEPEILSEIISGYFHISSSFMRLRDLLISPQ